MATRANESCYICMQLIVREVYSKWQCGRGHVLACCKQECEEKLKKRADVISVQIEKALHKKVPRDKEDVFKTTNKKEVEKDGGWLCPFEAFSSSVSTRCCSTLCCLLQPSPQSLPKEPHALLNDVEELCTELAGDAAQLLVQGHLACLDDDQLELLVRDEEAEDEDGGVHRKKRGKGKSKPAAEAPMLPAVKTARRQVGAAAKADKEDGWQQASATRRANEKAEATRKASADVTGVATSAR